MEIYGGSSRQKYVSQGQIKKMKEGGKKADEIKKISDNHHENIDIPNAESFLEENLENAYKKPKKFVKKFTKNEKVSVFKKISQFFQKFLQKK